MTMTELSARIKKGDMDAIMSGFLSSSDLYKAQAVIGCVNNRVYNPAIEKQLLKLQTNEDRIIGYRLADFAIAALVKLGNYTYSGNLQEITRLIETDKWFE